MGRWTRTKDEPQEGYYFFMWNLTDAGVKDVDSVRKAIRTASAMCRDLGGTCRLHVTTGGQYDMVGIARGITDAQASQLKWAVDALGLFKTTTFFKAHDFSLDEFDTHVAG